MKTNIFLFFLVFYFIWMIHPCFASAQILINEVYPSPDTTSSEPTEWIEIINPNFSTNIFPNLSLWSIWDTTTTPSLLFTFPDNFILSTQFFVIETNNKLNNTGDGVIIKDRNSNIIDQFHYSSSQTGMSWSRTSLTDSSFFLTTPTKNQINNLPPPPTPTPIPTPTPSPTTITPSATSAPASEKNKNLLPPSLSEIMACPEIGSEWIELFNPNYEIFYLNGWSLFDGQGKLVVFSDQIISPQSFFTVEINQKLNNSGDQVILKDSDQNIITQMSYNNCQKGFSWIWDGENWLESSIITKNTSNPEISAPTEEQVNQSSHSSPEAESPPSQNEPQLNTSQTFQQEKSSTQNNLKLPNTKLVTLINNPDQANFIESPPFYQHLFFSSQQKKIGHYLSVIMGGLSYLVTTIILVDDLAKNDSNKIFDNF